MSKNIENTKIEKLPTSQLVFYMTNPELGDRNLKSRIEAAVYGRLTKVYKLYPDMARKFVDREQEVIDTRGYDLESYSFGKDRAYDDLFRIFYESAELISRVVKTEDNFNTLTMSEIVEFYVLFTNAKKRYEKREKMLDKEFKNNESAQKKILNSSGIPFDTKEQEINTLKELHETLELQQTNEHSLIGYNDLLAKCMLSKLKTVMGYEKRDDIRAYLTMVKEAFLLIQKSPIQKQERKQYSDISFNAYAHDTAIISEFNVQGYPFSKKK